MINLVDLLLLLLDPLQQVYRNLDPSLLRLLLISVLDRLLGNLLRLAPGRGSGRITHSLKDNISANRLNYNHHHDLLMRPIQPSLDLQRPLDLARTILIPLHLYHHLFQYLVWENHSHSFLRFHHLPTMRTRTRPLNHLLFLLGAGSPFQRMRCPRLRPLDRLRQAGDLSLQCRLRRVVSRGLPRQLSSKVLEWVTDWA